MRDDERVDLDCCRCNSDGNKLRPLSRRVSVWEKWLILNPMITFETTKRHKNWRYVAKFWWHQQHWEQLEIDLFEMKEDLGKVSNSTSTLKWIKKSSNDTSSRVIDITLNVSKITNMIKPRVRDSRSVLRKAEIIVNRTPKLRVEVASETVTR